MEAAEFIHAPKIKILINELQRSKSRHPERFIFSDVIDKGGHQYVDFVQEGGGMLGIALVGYTYVLEQMGIRFVSLAGTSAGAINAILLAALGQPSEMKSLKIIEILARKDFKDFIDGGSDARKLVKLINRKHSVFKLVYRTLRVLDDLKEGMGLNPGRQFHQWLKNILEENGVNDVATLQSKMNAFPATIRFRNPEEHAGRTIEASLGLVAADLTTETKVVFPAMSALYFQNPEEVHPADFVRASMSIPLFFHPYLVKGLPQNNLAQWEKMASYKGRLPEEVKLVDGGFLSNFPIDIFHVVNKMPSRPTLGVKLGLDRTTLRSVDNYLELMYGCFNTASKIRDFEFIHRNPDFKQLFTNIDIGNHKWLNFNLSDQQKLDLFQRGADAAFHFLHTFDWEEYKMTRKNLLLQRIKEIEKDLT